MAKKYDVIALGELLIDFTMNGQSEQGNNMFEACPGGAPCNVLALLNKMGKKTAFIGKVGKDQFGTLLRDTITEAGIDASNLMVDENVNTTLAFVHTFPDGDREFSFYRNPGADMMLTADEVNPEVVKDTKVFHFGTLSMTHEGVREATKKAVETAKANGLKPYEYFEYLLTEIPKHQDESRTDFLADLLPWSEKLPESIQKPKKSNCYCYHLHPE